MGLMSREWHQAVAGNTLFFQTLLAAEIEQVDDECRVGHFPPRRRISFTVASMVPPVASRSSTTSTLSPGLIAST